MTTEIPTAEPFDAFEQRLAATLSAEAATVGAPADGLSRIHARVTHRRRARRATWIAAAAALVLIAGIVGVALRSSDQGSTPYVDTDTGGIAGTGLVRTSDPMQADWDHPALLVPDGSQWRISSYSPWVRYSIDAVVEDDTGQRHVTLEVEQDGPHDVVDEPWPGGARTRVGDETAVVTASTNLAAILWHPRPGITARLADVTSADRESEDRQRAQQEAIDAWQQAGGVGEPPRPELPSGEETPVAVDDATIERLVRLATRLVPIDRDTWLRGIDDLATVFVTGDGPADAVAVPLRASDEGSTARFMLPRSTGRTGMSTGPVVGGTTYQLDADGFPADTFELQVSREQASPAGGWTPVQVESWGGLGGAGDAYTPIFTPTTVRGAPGEFEHYPITTLERTEPDHVRTLRWVSEGHAWLLRFKGSASGDDALAVADSLVVPDDTEWQDLVFPPRPPPGGNEGFAFEQQWLRATGQLAP